MRLPVRNMVTGVAAAWLAVGCSATTMTHPSVPLPHDPHTAQALLKIATAFNHDYDTGAYGPVYARWDVSAAGRSSAGPDTCSGITTARAHRTLRLTPQSVSPGGPATGHGW